MNKTEQIKPLFTVDSTGRVSLNFHPGQVKAWKSRKRFIFVLAGSQSGKTSFGSWWIWREIKECGGGDYLAVSPTYDLFKLKLLPEMLDVFVNTLHIAKYHLSERILEIADPKTGKFSAKLSSDKMFARIILRSAEAGSKHGGAGVGGLESASAKGAWLDECGMDTFSLQAWEAVLRRLSLSEGRILGTSTIYNHGWLKSEIYDRWRKGDQNIDVVQCESIMNPAFLEVSLNAPMALYRPGSLICFTVAYSQSPLAWYITISTPRFMQYRHLRYLASGKGMLESTPGLSTRP